MGEKGGEFRKKAKSTTLKREKIGEQSTRKQESIGGPISGKRRSTYKW